MRNGQAAMSFMFNYGWAILVLAAVIGALSYFDVFSGSAPSTCMTGPGFVCNEFKATQDTMTLMLKSGIHDLTSANLGFGGDVMQCAAATITEKGLTGLPDTGIKTNRWWFNGTGSLRRGSDIGRITFSGCNLGGFAESDFMIGYVVAGENLDHSVNGRATLEVE